MKKLLVLLIGLIICAPATAHASESYLGGGMQFGALGRAPGPSSGCTQHTITFHPLLGAGIECGFRENAWMVYTGCRFGQAKKVQDGESLWSGRETKSTWTNYQLMIGGRIHVARTDPNPVKPCLGLAVTYGWTRYTYRADFPNYMEYGSSYDENRDSHFSKGGFGLLVELGFMIEVKGPITPFCIGQVHFFDADFNKDVYTNRDENKSMIESLLQIGFFVDLFNR